MTLMYLSLGYMAGIGLGQLAWASGLLDCETPVWLWLPALALLPLAPLLGRFQSRAVAPETMVWPQKAGFEPPPHSPISRALAVAICFSVLAGALRFASRPLDTCLTQADLAYHNLPASAAFDHDAPQVLVEGFVDSYPLVGDGKQRLDVRATTLIGGGAVQPVSGALRLNTGVDERYAYGQPVRLRGRLVTPPEFDDFSYRDYLARRGIHSLMYSAQIDRLPGDLAGNPIKRRLYAFRARGEDVLNRLLPEPYAGLANGMLLGIESGIPDTLYEKFNLTGTSHVIVISGSNVAVVAALFLAVGSRLLGRKRAVYPTLLGIAAFAILVGGDAAVLRAALMGGLLVWAIALGRRSTAYISLAAACYAMTLANPLALWDVGLQLSGAATFGVIVFLPPIAAAWEEFMENVRERWSTLRPTSTENRRSATADPQLSLSGVSRSLIEDGLLITVAATITTMPLVVYYFGRLSLVSLLTNVLIAPVQPFIMLWGSAGVLAGVVGLTWLAQALLVIPWLSLVWTVTMVEWSVKLPGASLAIDNFGLPALIATYGIVFGMRWRTQIKRAAVGLTGWARFDWRARLLRPVTLVALLLLATVLWRAALTQPDGRLHVHFLDIGQGDGILITTPSGRHALIDGGKSPQTLFNELGAAMPYWDRTIDLLLLTHPDADHMAAQALIPNRFQIVHALDTAISQPNPDAASWRRSVDRAGATVHVQHEGGWVDLGDGVALWVLWPPPHGLDHEHADNENSLVVKLVYGDFSVLLTGDAGLPSETVWLQSGAPLPATVLKVGHHGSNSATGPDFVAAVNPAVSVIQVGEENDYGHPTDEVLATLTGRGGLVLRNDLHGRIHIASDGAQMWIETEKGAPAIDGG